MKSKIRRYVSIKICFVLVLAATGYLGSSCQYTPPGKPEGRLLVIMSRYARDSGYELIDLHGRRSDISKTFGVAGLAHKPAVWSPSGERLAYGGSTAEDDGYRSWIFDVDIATMTAQKYPLLDDGHAYDLTWSADGMSFLFVWARDYPEPAEIWRLDRASGQTSVLSQLPVGVGIESWSPDRSLVAIIIGQTYVKEPNSLVWKSGDLYIQNVDGTSRRMIHTSVFGDVVWSPDGKSIAFENAVELPPGPEHIYWMPVENGETICLQERGDL